MGIGARTAPSRPPSNDGSPAAAALKDSFALKRVRGRRHEGSQSSKAGYWSQCGSKHKIGTGVNKHVVSWVTCTLIDFVPFLHESHTHAAQVNFQIYSNRR